MLYRLAYADAQQLRPYAQARWSMPPGSCCASACASTWAQRRVVLSGGDAPAALTLRLELEEFSHLFESPTQSSGVVRLRATLVGHAAPAWASCWPSGRLSCSAPRPRPMQRAGCAHSRPATDAAVQDILSQWLQQLP